MRMPREDVTADEAEFRDRLHGGLVWALGIILGAALLFAAAGAVTRAGTELAGRAAIVTSQNADPVAYATDAMLRSMGGPPRAAGGTSVTPGANERAKVGRILTRAIATGGLPDSDKSYLASLVVRSTGISEPEAQGRVNDAFAEASHATREAADKARHAAVLTGLLTAVSLLAGLGPRGGRPFAAGSIGINQFRRDLS
jgi:hypothetical protein